MAKLVQVNEPIAARRRFYFDIRGTDGVTPIDTEAGGQPQISIDGAAWTNSGIDVLVLIGEGRYYAESDVGSFATVGSFIESRYKGTLTVDTPGDVIQVVGFDPTKPFYAPGNGSIVEVTRILDVNNQPIQFVDTWVTTDEAGLNQVAGVLRTDADGQVTFLLDAGTYYLWRQHPDYSFSNPKTMVVG